MPATIRLELQDAVSPSLSKIESNFVRTRQSVERLTQAGDEVSRSFAKAGTSQQRYYAEVSASQAKQNSLLRESIGLISAAAKTAATIGRAAERGAAVWTGVAGSAGGSAASSDPAQSIADPIDRNVGSITGNVAHVRLTASALFDDSIKAGKALFADAYNGVAKNVEGAGAFKGFGIEFPGIRPGRINETAELKDRGIDGVNEKWLKIIADEKAAAQDAERQADVRVRDAQAKIDWLAELQRRDREQKQASTFRTAAQGQKVFEWKQKAFEIAKRQNALDAQSEQLALRQLGTLLKQIDVLKKREQTTYYANKERDRLANRKAELTGDFSEVDDIDAKKEIDRKVKAYKPREGGPTQKQYRANLEQDDAIGKQQDEAQRKRDYELWQAKNQQQQELARDDKERNRLKLEAHRRALQEADSDEERRQLIHKREMDRIHDETDATKKKQQAEEEASQKRQARQEQEAANARHIQQEQDAARQREREAAQNRIAGQIGGFDLGGGMNIQDAAFEIFHNSLTLNDVKEQFKRNRVFDAKAKRREEQEAAKKAGEEIPGDLTKQELREIERDAEGDFMEGNRIDKRAMRRDRIKIEKQIRDARKTDWTDEDDRAARERMKEWQKDAVDARAGKGKYFNPGATAEERTDAFEGALTNIGDNAVMQGQLTAQAAAVLQELAKQAAQNRQNLQQTQDSLQQIMQFLQQNRQNQVFGGQR